MLRGTCRAGGHQRACIADGQPRRSARSAPPPPKPLPAGTAGWELRYNLCQPGDLAAQYHRLPLPARGGDGRDAARWLAESGAVARRPTGGSPTEAAPILEKRSDAFGRAPGPPAAARSRPPWSYAPRASAPHIYYYSTHAVGPRR